MPRVKRSRASTGTASGSIDTLLATQESSNLTTITVSDSNFVNSTTTFAITDTHLNTQGAELANNLGHVVAYGMFDDDPEDDDDNCPPWQGRRR